MDLKLQRWAEVKRSNKEVLRQFIKNRAGIDIPIDALYDIQVLSEEASSENYIIMTISTVNFTFVF